MRSTFALDTGDWGNEDEKQKQQILEEIELEVARIGRTRGKRAERK